jgi:hypothetical protein
MVIIVTIKKDRYTPSKIVAHCEAIGDISGLRFFRSFDGNKYEDGLEPADGQ